MIITLSPRTGESMVGAISVDVPFIEVHATNIHKRETFRYHSYLRQSSIVWECIGIQLRLSMLRSISNWNRRQSYRRGVWDSEYLLDHIRFSTFPSRGLQEHLGPLPNLWSRTTIIRCQAITKKSRKMAFNGTIEGFWFSLAAYHVHTSASCIVHECICLTCNKAQNFARLFLHNTELEVC